jgi:hypothetical protein
VKPVGKTMHREWKPSEYGILRHVPSRRLRAKQTEENNYA